MAEDDQVATMLDDEAEYLVEPRTRHSVERMPCRRRRLAEDAADLVPEALEPRLRIVRRHMREQDVVPVERPGEHRGVVEQASVGIRKRERNERSVECGHDACLCLRRGS